MRKLVSIVLFVLSEHLGRQVLVIVIESLLGVVENIIVIFENWVVAHLFLGQVFTNLIVHLCNSHTSRIERDWWPIPKLVPRWNLERREDLIDGLFLGGTQTRIVLEFRPVELVHVRSETPAHTRLLSRLENPMLSLTCRIF
jgi:hypothetical protein